MNIYRRICIFHFHTIILCYSLIILILLVIYYRRVPLLSINLYFLRTMRLSVYVRITINVHVFICFTISEFRIRNPNRKTICFSFQRLTPEFFSPPPSSTNILSFHTHTHIPHPHTCYWIKLTIP